MYEMEDGHHNGVQDRFSGRVMGIPPNERKLHFQASCHEQKHKAPIFDDWYTFELLPQHLQYEALQSYEEWTKGHVAELIGVEDYWIGQIKLIHALKEGVIDDMPSLEDDKP